MDELVFDQYTPLSFKEVLSRDRFGIPAYAPSWVGRDHTRRLQAYKLLQSYIDNASRFFLDTTGGPHDDHREYGDAALIVNQTLSSLIGTTHTITTDGADDEENTEALEFQEWATTWADLERFPLKMLECERNSVGLGDGVYTLGWNTNRQRARLRTYDPGFYFPALDDYDDDEYPNTVSIAWEIETDEPGVHQVRRIRWELGPTPDGIPRQYAWNEEPVDRTCYMSDATWTVDMSGRRSVDDLDPDRGDYATWISPDGEESEWRDVDLYLDFIPVVHIPNTVSLAEHYGRSVLTTVLQILDDLASADTDLQASAATTGKPPIVLSGARLSEEEIDGYAPGDVWQVGENGRLDTLDTSAALGALSRYIDDLLQRVSVNARLPEALLGRVDPSDVPSGLALRLGFGPLETMIREMRQVRAEKYRLLFKFAHRLALAAQADDVPERWVSTGVTFGSFLPSDQAAAIDTVTRLLELKPPAISQSTAIQILQEAGLPISDAQAEIESIQRQDFEGANRLLDALGSEERVAEYLGVPASTPVAAPPVDFTVDLPDLPEREGTQQA